MKRSFWLGVVALVGVGGSAMAGGKDYIPVTINTSARSAVGGLGTARNSTDSSYIGCMVDATTATTNPMTVMCYARDAAGVSATCFAFDAHLVQAALAVNGDSEVQFAWDASGKCTHVAGVNSSTLEPKR